MAHYLLIVVLTAIACWSAFTLVGSIVHPTPKEKGGRSTIHRITVVMLCAGTLFIAWFPLHGQPWAVAGVACSALAGVLAATAIRGVANTAAAVKETKDPAVAKQLQNTGSVLALAFMVPWALLSLAACVCVVLAPL